MFGAVLGELRGETDEADVMVVMVFEAAAAAAGMGVISACLCGLRKGSAEVSTADDEAGGVVVIVLKAAAATEMGAPCDCLRGDREGSDVVAEGNEIITFEEGELTRDNATRGECIRVGDASETCAPEVETNAAAAENTLIAELLIWMVPSKHLTPPAAAEMSDADFDGTPGVGGGDVI